MINNIKKLELYNILNSIKMAYLKSKEPFNILTSDIKLTYKIVELKYLKDKNYFVKVKKSTGSNKFSKPTFSKEEHAAYLERQNRRDRSQSPDRTKTKAQSPNQKPNRVFTAEETAAYLERQNRRDRSQSPDKKHNKSPYIIDKTQDRRDRSQDRRDRSQSPSQKPNRVFTAEETAAYLERQNRREKSQSPTQKTGGLKKNSSNKVLVYC